MAKKKTPEAQPEEKVVLRSGIYFNADNVLQIALDPVGNEIEICLAKADGKELKASMKLEEV